MYIFIIANNFTFHYLILLIFLMFLVFFDYASHVHYASFPR